MPKHASAGPLLGLVACKKLVKFRGFCGTAERPFQRTRRRMLSSVHATISNAFGQALKDAFPNLPDEATSPAVTAANPKFGDYQCNNAMALYKKFKSELGNPGKPVDLAEQISARLSKALFDEVSVAPAGFITVKVSKGWLSSTLKNCLSQPLSMEAPEKMKCVVDYSSPNIAKEMHVGHLRSTILGEAICRVLEFVGHTVLRINHLGDWGTQFGMLIEYMREAYPEFQSNPPKLSDLTTFYREAKARFDADPEFKQKAQQNVGLLQGGDVFCRDAWKLFCEISRKDFQQIYDRLIPGVDLIPRGESYYNDMIGPIVEDLKERGLAVMSNGAVCFFAESDASKRAEEVPLMLVKSDGGYGYDSTDIACINHRLSVEKHRWLIYVTDLGQAIHFEKIFKAAEIIGWHTPPQTLCNHVGFGLIQGEDGKKFKTRSGDLVKLVDLLDEAVDRSYAEIKERWAQATDNEDEEGGFIDARKAAEIIGYSAVKYFDLKQNRTTNYRFSYDKMLDPRGNTAVYLLYAYARICAIFRKAHRTAESLAENALKIETSEERKLALQLLKLPEVINVILEDFCMHRLAEYVYDLSGCFTEFYQNCKVVGSPQEESRLILCELTRKFLEKGFRLLGIVPLTRI